MASTDGGAHQPPNDLHAENTVPLGNLDVSSWWTALQDDSILASYDADCLQHIFSRLELFDAMPLGFTCRRLYYYFKESQKKTKALNLTIGKNRPSLCCTAIYSHLRQPSIVDSVYYFASGQLNIAYSTDGSATVDYSQFTNYYNYNTLKFFDFIWHPLAQLQHPALRHLTLNLDADESKDFDEIPPLQILRQLTSFTFVHTKPQLSVIHKVIEALRKENYGVHLIPGIGACIGLTLFKNHKFHTVSIEPELLPFITFLDVTIGWSNSLLLKPDNYELSLASFFVVFLKCIKFRVNLKSLTYTDYPSFLTAISSLPLLDELFLEINNLEDHGIYHHIVWPSTALPVLPRVRHLSLALLCNDHSNVVKKFHLMHCFPELQKLCCAFDHDTECYESSRGPQFHICGQELTRGLLELIPEKIVKRIEFLFNGIFYFNSLEDLMAESRRKEQLKVANRLLADRDGECAELRATNELLKAQLAQTDLTLRESQTQVHSLIAKQLSLEENITKLQTEQIDYLGKAKAKGAQ
ncbi:hypothetical protein TYRP_016481 [Tyrophagus putrescentiae]|nr:hypothetical protein TYRP_016481 [Tyrophagus putrescentiae]